MEALIELLHTMPPEVIWVAQLLACYVGVVLMLRFFGALGLQVYLVVAVIAANLQVLKAVPFSFLPDPVALGTALFATTYLCTDVLNERYGPTAARKAVWLGFVALLLFVMWTFFAVAFRPVDATAGAAWAWAAANHEHLQALFTPMPALLLAGLTAYLLSQLHDVWLYQKLKKLTGGRLLWLRNNLSTALSALLDNIIFSVLAWIVLAADPLPWKVVVVTYILGTWILRLVVAVLDTPFIYLARRWPRETGDTAS